MAILQSTYAGRHPALSLGQVRNTELYNMVSKLLDDATAVGFGRAVFRGTGNEGVTATNSAFFEGVTARSLTAENAVADTYAQRETMPLLKMGVIAVQASVAVNRGEQAYVTAAGAWTNVVGANQIIAGATFDETITAAGLVALRIK